MAHLLLVLQSDSVIKPSKRRGIVKFGHRHTKCLNCEKTNRNKSFQNYVQLGISFHCEIPSTNCDRSCIPMNLFHAFHW